MIQFRKILQDRVMQLITTWCGSDVKLVDSYLHDVEPTQLPFVVVNVRTAEKAGESEIGAKYDLMSWTVHIYYLDTVEDYHAGDATRDKVVSIIHKRLQEDRRLGNLEITDTEGTKEYVYDSSVSAALFDSSGQDGYYSFVTELYLNVYTART